MMEETIYTAIAYGYAEVFTLDGFKVTATSSATTTSTVSGKGTLAAGNLSVSLPVTTSANVGSSLNIGSIEQNVTTQDVASFFLNSTTNSSNASIQYRANLASNTLSNLTVALINNTFSISYGGSYFV